MKGMQGTFISFEGVDGVGKTTQVERLRAYVESQGRECVVTREPGGTALGVAIRKMLLHGVDTGDENDCADIAPRAEALLFAADRAQQAVHDLSRMLRYVLCWIWIRRNRMRGCSMPKTAWRRPATTSSVAHASRSSTWLNVSRNGSTLLTQASPSKTCGRVSKPISTP